MLNNLAELFGMECKCGKCTCKKQKEPKVTYEKHNLGIVELSTYIDITGVKYHEPFTTMYFHSPHGDKLQVQAKCMEEDEYSKEKGYEICIMKALQLLIEKDLKKF